MTLKEILNTIKRGTKVCICDDCGPWNDVCPIEELPAIAVINSLDSVVDNIYVDPEDMSLVIELKPYVFTD